MKLWTTLSVITLAVSSIALGAKNPMVGGKEMFPNKDIIDNAVKSADHTTLVAAVKAAGLVDTLLKPENKPMLVKILTYHVVPGRLRAHDLMKMIKDGKDKAELKTVSGGTLTAMMHGQTIMLKDEKGDVSTVAQADVFQSNGVIHVVDSVVLPN
jgi:uncharacterized surface protein with fasciclin (FAS1) repeats